MFGKWTICLKWPLRFCTAWQLYRSIGGHLTFLTVDRIWQAERANNEIKSSGRVSAGVYVAVSWVLYHTFLFLCVRVPRAAVIGVSSTPDWFEKLDKMSPVWKQPIYKPSSRNFRETPVPSKSEWELLATSGSEVKKKSLASKATPHSRLAASAVKRPVSFSLVSFLSLSLWLCLFTHLVLLFVTLWLVFQPLFLVSLHLSRFSVKLWRDTLAVNFSHSSLSKEWPCCIPHRVCVCCFIPPWDSMYSCLCVSVITEL